MKKVILFVSFFAAALISHAQYVDKPSSHWFISLEGGAGWLGAEDYGAISFSDNLKLVRPTVGLSVGKWINPSLGFRLNVSGAKLYGYSPGDGGHWYLGDGEDYVGPNGETYFLNAESDVQREYVREHFLDEEFAGGYNHSVLYGAATVDALVNLRNLFGTYNPEAVFNPIFYTGIGYVHNFKDEKRCAQNNMVGKLGLMFDFKLNNKWDVFLAGESLFVPEYFDYRLGGDKVFDNILNLKLGLTYNFGGSAFVKAPIYDQDQLDAMNAELNALRNRKQITCDDCEPKVIEKVVEKEVVKEVSSQVELTPVFFTINSYSVRDNQLVSVARAAQYLIDNPSAKLEVAAYADAKTGNSSYNMSLSKKRANAVVNVLTTKFGIDKSRLSVAFYGDTVQPFKVNEENRVAIFVK